MEEFDFLYYEESTVAVDSSELDWGMAYICPNCGEPFDGHHCSNCLYTDLYY